MFYISYLYEWKVDEESTVRLILRVMHHVYQLPLLLSLTYCSSDLIGEFDIFLLAKKLQDSLLEVFQEKRNMTLIVKSEES